MAENRKVPKLHSDEQIRANELARVIKDEKTGGGEKLKDIDPTPGNYKKFKGEGEARPWPRGILWGAIGLVALFVIGSIISYYFVKEKLKTSISSQVGALQTGVADLQNFDPQSAQQEFSVLAQDSSSSFESALGAFGSLFEGGKNAIASFGDLADQLSALSGEATSLESGGNLVVGLTNIKNTLLAIDNDSDQLSGVLASLSSSSTQSVGNFYLPLKARIEAADDFLNVFIPWLANPTPHHILVLFENPSEMRPGGGFLGSYADVTIASGTITNVAFHDIADVDAGFNESIIPPAQLQSEVKGFRPADTNWFFDFPTSASKTIQFFQASQPYAASSTTFDGVVAITPTVASDLLSVTGPITVASTTFSSSTLVRQIQNIVQQGQATSATYPKAILGELSQAIFQQLASSTPAEKQQLLATALDWVSDRDVMAYFTDPAFENFLASYGATGDVYQLPQNFNGDYLAIVDADINSDKSELYVNQNISFDAQIGVDGTITDTLTIDRDHTGNQSPYWWYQTTNQDYVQLFVPDGSSLVNETGGVKKMIVPLLSAAQYTRQDYSTDPTIVAIQSTTQPLFIYPAVTTHEEDGKEVFATWAIVAKGKTTELSFDYTHASFVQPADGVQYQFVFEKQAGTRRSYDLEIDAPLGYVFAENGLASYEYQSSDPPGRLIITLTLQAIN